ncbi:SDR family NAD(P)-dependent oxidoreductase [Nitrobacter sp. TKz-YC02]|uniref:SDR family NAD(P)-dependent oxidoreductase n=1 Tax=Nitrobacter sp. TKz-YC02 TaxID=3398704 RepID=UPI003CFBA9F6
MSPQARAFEGSTAVVTGGGTGVGAAVALALASAGANLHLIGRRVNMLDAIGARARTMGVQATSHPADLSTSCGQLELTQRLAQVLSSVDILIQNAGIHFASALAQAKLDELDALFVTNVRAPYALTQALLPMLKARQGQVVFINSSSALLAKPLTAQYDATKHALKAIADALRGEVNADGIRVLSVYLGRTATEMQERIHKIENKPYRPELLLQPADVAYVIMNALSMPRTAEVTDIHIRPMIKT